MTVPSTTTNIPPTGIRDPDDPSRWLVRPWPVGAGFCEVVRHFLNAYVWRLLGDPSTARQLAYFEVYQAALTTAPTDDLRYPAAWHWRDDLRQCVAACVTNYREQQSSRG